MRPLIPRTNAGRVLALALAAGLVAIPMIGLTVNDQNIFELEGNAEDDAASGDDWENIADDRPGGPGLIAQNNANVQTFITDGLDSTDTAFMGGGSKDVNNINQWQHVTAAVSPIKNEIGHAFAAAYTDPSNGHLLIYFGLDRSGEGGTAATGFWFFKDKVSIAPNGAFSGSHTVGDILVTSDYVQGGGVGEINVFRWVGGQKPLQVVGSSTTGGGFTVGDRFCLNNATGQTTPMACAASNSSVEDVPSSWSTYQFKSGGAFTARNTFPTRTFFEGGIDITQIFGTGSTCFASFMAMTRTSASTSAQLKDFALGDFGLCDMNVAKACAVEAGVSPVVNPDGVSVHTKFTITVTNPSGGTLRDVQLVETATLGGNSGRSCQVSAINLGAGGTAANPAVTLNQNLASGTAFEVANTLAGNSSMTVTLSCDTLDNPFLNKVEARAKTFVGAGDPDLIRTYEIKSGDDVQDECEAPTPASIDVAKDCVGDGVTLVNTAGGMKARACFSIEVTNTGPVALKDLVVSDPKISASSLVAAGTTLGPSGSLTDSILLGDTNGNGSIDAGEGLCFDAVAPDNGETDPSLAEFGNRVDVTANPAIGNAGAQTDYSTDECPLCR